MFKEFIYKNQEPVSTLSFFSLVNLYRLSIEYRIESLRKKTLIEIRNCGFQVLDFDQDWPEVSEQLPSLLYDYYSEFHSDQRANIEVFISKNILDIEFRVVVSKLREKEIPLEEIREQLTIGLHLSDLLQLKNPLLSMHVKKFLRTVYISKREGTKLELEETLDALSLFDFPQITDSMHVLQKNQLTLVLNSVLTEMHLDFLAIAFPDTRYIRTKSSYVDFKNPLKAFEKFKNLHKLIVFNTQRHEIFLPMTEELLKSLDKISFDGQHPTTLKLAVSEDTEENPKKISEYVERISNYLKSYFAVTHIPPKAGEKIHYFQCLVEQPG